MIHLGQHVEFNFLMVLDNMKTVHISIIKNRQKILFLLSKRYIFLSFFLLFYLNILEKGFGEGKGETKGS